MVLFVYIILFITEFVCNKMSYRENNWGKVVNLCQNHPSANLFDLVMLLVDMNFLS